MTEKRFHFDYVLGDTGLIDEQATEVKWFIENCCNISDLKKNWITVCNKLNELADKNEQLKQSLLSTSKELQYGVKKVQQLAKENEELKKKCEYMEDVLNNQGYEVVFNGERWVIE